MVQLKTTTKIEDFKEIRFYSNLTDLRLIQNDL